MARIHSSRKTDWTISEFLPYGPLWDYMTKPSLDISPEVAFEVLSTYEDACSGAYCAIEGIKSRLTVIVEAV